MSFWVPVLGVKFDNDLVVLLLLQALSRANSFAAMFHAERAAAVAHTLTHQRNCPSLFGRRLRAMNRHVFRCLKSKPYAFALYLYHFDPYFAVVDEDLIAFLARYYESLDCRSLGEFAHVL
jgi:hypothetical protein